MFFVSAISAIFFSAGIVIQYKFNLIEKSNLIEKLFTKAVPKKAVIDSNLQFNLPDEGNVNGGSLKYVSSQY